MLEEGRGKLINDVGVDEKIEVRVGVGTED